MNDAVRARIDEPDAAPGFLLDGYPRTLDQVEELDGMIAHTGHSLDAAVVLTVDAEELVTSGKAGRLVRGFRGAPAADVGSLVDLVHRLAALGDHHPAVAELDLNPVLAFPDRCVAVDARVRIRRPDLQRREKSW